MATTATGARVVEVTEPGSPDFAALLAVRQGADAELNPTDPVTPAAELAAELFLTPPDLHAQGWLATDGGAPVGALTLQQHRDGVNDAAIELDAMTLPAHRRRGVARALLRVGLDAVAALGGTSVIGWSVAEPGAALCRTLGLTHRQDDRESRLRIADLDADQQRRWIEEAPARAAGYRLEGWVGVTPDEWAEPLARALASMVDAPIDGFDWTVQPVRPDELVGRERWWDARGFDVVTTLALAPGGEPAGASQILVSRLRPTVANQADTGVVAAHRGHRLGRWLKAENMRRALAHAPGIEVVDTMNAESNPHMLAINVDMGFRPHHAYATFQGDLATARAAVG
jgi:GNAT superfamily N-acetyltransferase